MKLVMFSPASRRTSSRSASTPGPVTSGMKVMMVFEVAGVIAVGAGVEFLDHITRGDDKEFGVRAIEILHVPGEGVEIVEFAADAGAERHAAGLQVAAGGGVGGCGFGLQMVFGDEPGALGQTVRVGADGVAGAVVDAVARAR